VPNLFWYRDDKKSVKYFTEKGLPMSDQLANVEAYQVKPTGTLLLVEAELAPAKSATGKLEVAHVKTADEVARKGLVVAVGRDVKHIKAGMKVLYLFNGFMEIESFYRKTYGAENPRGIIEEKNIIATCKPAELTVNAKDVVRCLKADAMAAERKKAMLEQDKAVSQALAGSNIIWPN
jgi:hypothetical protein